MKISRRDVAKGSLTLPALYMQLRSTPLMAANHFEEDAGVASGSPTETTVVIWTRVPGRFQATLQRGQTQKVGYEVSRTESFRSADIVTRGQIETNSQKDFTVKKKITGLSAFSTYYFRFKTDTGYTSVTGRTKTAPSTSQDPASLKFAVVACQRFSGGYYTAYAHLAHENVDYVVHLGDHIYEIESGRARPDEAFNGRIAKSLNDYRLKYRHYLSDASWREVRRLFPSIDIWDDHEVTDNYAGPTMGQSDPGRLKSAYQAYCEYLPVDEEIVPNSTAAPEYRLYRQMAFGGLVDLFVLDQRQYRTECACADDFMTAGCPEMQSTANTILGNRQKQWFKQASKASRAKWKFVLSEVVFAKFFLPKLDLDKRIFVPEELENFEKDENNVYFNLDAWDGYPAERLELVKHFATENVENVIFLTGDVHSAYNSKIFLDGDPDPKALEIVTSPISSAPLIKSLNRMYGARATQTILDTNPWTVWADIEHNGYTILETKQDEMIVTHKIVNSTASTQASLSVARVVRVPAGNLDFIG